MAPLQFLDRASDGFAAAHGAGVAPLAPRMQGNENNCACGCNQRHNRAVSGM